MDRTTAERRRAQLTPHSAETTWLYYKLRAGSHSWKETEIAIMDVVPAVVRCWDFPRWFFVRYLDDGGLHVRLRLNCPAATGDDARAAVSSELRCWMNRVAENATRSVTIQSAETGAYVRDVQDFGEHGTSIAEDLFHVSSAIAIETLLGERNGRCCRKTIAPVLMQCTAGAFVGPETHVDFWQRYASYWLDGKPRQASGLRGLFHQKAGELAASGITSVASAETLTADERQLAARWNAAVQSAAIRFAEIDDDPAPHLSNLAFHFIHLMNNRLGVRQTAEAYLATLLSLGR